MVSFDIPFLGNLLLWLVLVAAAYSLAMSVATGRGRTELLLATRYGVYATCALVAVAVAVLAYAFVTHDFRIRYVARYSDRSMPEGYLLAALWGGQDGSLLWWSFLLCGFSASCTRWMRWRHTELQPWVLATLMSILLFFVGLMLFAANPFETWVGRTPVDGEGLNPLLQNYWMTIHPPALYLGFVGWSVPFAFAVAALITGRLHDEWTRASRKWTLIAWTFLSVGLLLGMLWSYEELGWGGYWAWDPVENASFMPWLVGTAYLHSVMVQERYQMLRVWNVFLIMLTFIMTIFGTFLTRSGLIASVHSFAESDIGTYFVGYLLFLVVASAALIVWRLPKLKAEHRIESLVSREFAFLLNNWVLLGMMVFVLVATTFPLISEWLRGQEVTVGPPFYNRWMVPFGLLLLLLLGIGPLLSWRKATGKNLRRAFRIPVIAGLTVGGLHATLGAWAGVPPIVESEAIYETVTGRILSAILSVAPLLSTTLSAFVLATVAQEFARGTAVRARSAGEPAYKALLQLIARARRRYGGYVVHVGIVWMGLGFTGAAYDTEVEGTLIPGETLAVGDYTLRYEAPRVETDPNKRMVFTDLTVLDRRGHPLSTAAPAKFIYRTHPQMPTTEVAIRSRPLEDLYIIMSTVDPITKRATFRIVVRPFVAWIWFGGVLLLLGAAIAMFPSVRDLLAESRRPTNRRMRRALPALAALALSLSLYGSMAMAPLPAAAQSGGSSSLHAGTVVSKSPEERKLFARLLCQCGDCARLALETCGCGWAERARAEVREDLASGKTVEQIMNAYRDRYGPKALSVPADRGLDRTVWAAPVAGFALAAALIVALGFRWRRRSQSAQGDASTALEAPNSSEVLYDAKLDDELRKLEES